MPHERSQAKKNIYCKIPLYKILENIEYGWTRERGRDYKKTQGNFLGW